MSFLGKEEQWKAMAIGIVAITRGLCVSFLVSDRHSSRPHHTQVAITRGLCVSFLEITDHNAAAGRLKLQSPEGSACHF